MNTLLIGGTNDGKRMDIPAQHDRIRLPVSSYLSDSSNLVSVQMEIYEHQRLRGGSTTFVVFAIQGMTGDQIIEKLIQCYSPCQP